MFAIRDFIFPLLYCFPNYRHHQSDLPNNVVTFAAFNRVWFISRSNFHANVRISASQVFCTRHK